MTITEVAPRPVGRPPAAKGTIRILPSGVIRLSPDLCYAKSYSIYADRERKQLVIKAGGPFKLRYSGPNAQSGRLMAASVFELLGSTAEDLAGEYEVRRRNAGGFVANLEAQ